jgi:hypothetical protein
MANIIQIIEPLSETILKEFPIEQLEEAQNYATHMEKLGVSVTINAPSLPETLALELGADSSEMATLREMILDEIESHNEGPCG